MNILIFQWHDQYGRLDSNLLKLDKKSHKSIGFYYIGSTTMKDSDYVKINSVNSLCLIIDNVDGYIEKKMEVNT